MFVVNRINLWFYFGYLLFLNYLKLCWFIFCCIGKLYIYIYGERDKIEFFVGLVDLLGINIEFILDGLLYILFLYGNGFGYIFLC